MEKVNIMPTWMKELSGAATHEKHLQRQSVSAEQPTIELINTVYKEKSNEKNPDKANQWYNLKVCTISNRV